jgi:hypothetical protein
MAKRKSAVAEAAPTTITEQPVPQMTDTATTTLPAEAGQRPYERLPEIREMKSIKLGPDRNSPRLRLLRNYRFNQIQIRADEELPQAAREQLQAAGWRDRTEEEGIWTKQLPPRPRKDAEDPEPAKPGWPTVVEAERLFHDLANAIWADKGLPSVGQERGAGTPF